MILAPRAWASSGRAAAGITSSEVPTVTMQSHRPAAWSGSGTILLVDDEPQVRQVASHMLRRLGFEVVEAADGREAVERFRAAGITRYLILALYHDVSCHLALAEHTGDLDRTRVLGLCGEGEALCGPMEDQTRLAFFRQVREQLEGTGALNR